MPRSECPLSVGPFVILCSVLCVVRRAVMPDLSAGDERAGSIDRLSHLGAQRDAFPTRSSCFCQADNVSPTTIERMTAFDHCFSRAQATDVVHLDWGFALLQRDFPLSHYHNRIVVTSAVPAAEILSTADKVLGGIGLRHRYVSVDDDSLGRNLRADFLAAGYEHSPIVSMAYCGSAVVVTHSHDVVAVSLETLRPAIIRQWRGDLPTATEDELEQLADRTALYSRGAELTLLAVYDGNEIAAHADLYVARKERVAQFENLATHEHYRGRGYGTALVRDALRRSQDAGCDLAFLTVDRDDWPIEWYRRLGFAEAAQTHHFSRID